jgi:hypothetical protein
MNRIIVVLAVAAGIIVAACGSTAHAGSAAASPTPDRGAQFRNGAAGQLVQINGQTLILTAASGDLTVTYTSTTTFSRTSNAVLADVVPGLCILATGQKDSAGALTAMTVRLSPKPSAGCGAGQFGGANQSPPPGASPRPSPSGQPAMAFVSGEVTAATGISITVKTSAGGSQTITVPTTASVTRMSSATPTDLRIGECLRANGARDAAGTVAATTIAITPAGPSGTCATGFGGGRGRPGAGAAPGAAAPNG